MSKVIFFDIETVHETNHFPTYAKKDVWEKKYCKEMPADFTPETFYYDKAAIHPEF